VSAFLAPHPSPSSPLPSLMEPEPEPEPSEIEEYLRGLAVGPSQPEEGGPNIGQQEDAHYYSYAGFNLLLLVPRVVARPLNRRALHGAVNRNTPLPREAAGIPRAGKPLDVPLPGGPTQPLGAPTPSGDGSVKPNPSQLSYGAYVVTNHGAGGEITHRPLTHEERRYGGQSNGVDGRGGEGWLKLKKGLEGLKKIVQLGEDGDAVPEVAEDQIIEELFELLTWVSSL